MEREAARRLVGTMLVDAGLPVTVVGEDRFLTQLAGEHKRTIPVLLHVDERSLKVSSLVAGAPDEQHDASTGCCCTATSVPRPSTSRSTTRATCCSSGACRSSAR
jgi:hypothetical protein